MTQDGTPGSVPSHPFWCDRTICTVTGPSGSHQSASHVVPADPPVDVVVEMHLASTMRGLAPRALLMLEFGVGDEAEIFPLTLRQARQLHDGLDKLLSAAA